MAPKTTELVKVQVSIYEPSDKSMHRNNSDSGMFQMLGRCSARIAITAGDEEVVLFPELKGMLGIDNPEREKDCLEYSPDEAELMRKVDERKAQLAFLLNSVPVSGILEVADAGARMPPKSTYFYPKTPAGLVVNPLF